MAARMKSVRRGIVLSPYPLNVTGGSRSVKQKVVSGCHRIPASAAAASQKSPRKLTNQIAVAMASSIMSLVFIILPFYDKRALKPLFCDRCDDRHRSDGSQPRQQGFVFELFCFCISFCPFCFQPQNLAKRTQRKIPTMQVLITCA